MLQLVMAHAVAPALDVDFGCLLKEPSDDCAGHSVIGKGLSPVAKASVPGQDA
jgi:hypothetical protein